MLIDTLHAVYIPLSISIVVLEPNLIGPWINPTTGDEVLRWCVTSYIMVATYVDKFYLCADLSKLLGNGLNLFYGLCHISSYIMIQFRF